MMNPTGAFQQVEAANAALQGVRPAVAKDVPAIVTMGQRFLASSPYAAILRNNPEQMARFAVLVMEGGGLFVLEDAGVVVGMIGLLAAPHYFSNDLIATEVVWWLEPEHRGAGRLLLETAEQWARSVGAVAIQMIAPDDRVGRLYERAGYRFVERAYQKTW